jgi:2-haloacid dehalogenase
MSSPQPQPRAVLFDVFGTVVDWRGSLIADLTGWGGKRGMAADWTGLVDAWRGAYAPSMDEVRHGTKPWTVLDDLHRASLDRLLPRFGVTGLADADIAHLNGLWHRLRPWPDSVPGLTRLRQNRIVAALSNGNVALLVAMAKHAGLPWDMVFGADIYRHYKPDPETYLGACALLRLPPSEVMLAAAHPGDLAAARTCGLRTAFISRPQEFGPGHEPVAPGGDWDIVAGDILDLAARLA